MCTSADLFYPMRYVNYSFEDCSLSSRFPSSEQWILRPSWICVMNTEDQCRNIRNTTLSSCAYPLLIISKLIICGNIWLLLHLEPSLEDLKKAVVFIDEHVKRGENVLIHCRAGRGRRYNLYFILRFFFGPAYD